jgi:hypothetical protein
MWDATIFEGDMRREMRRVAERWVVCERAKSTMIKTGEKEHLLSLRHTR